MKSFKDFCAEAYSIDEVWKQSKVPKSVIANQMKINKEKEANRIGSKAFSDRGGHAALKAGGGQAALRSGSSVSDVLHAGKRAVQQKEGPYISPESKAKTNLMNAQAEKLRREPTAKKPIDDFAAGGGEAKMKKTGMTRDQVIAQGKKNLANQ
jgi:hypothetical protein